VNVTKATLESLFTDELARLQPSPGYVRLLKESVLQVWRARKEAVRAELADADRHAKAIQAKLDRLDEAFLFERSIDIDVYDRHAEKLRQELTLLRMDRHASEVEELDVEGILAVAERILPRAADLCVQSSLDQRQRPPQPPERSATCRDSGLGMKVWWTRLSRVPTKMRPSTFALRATVDNLRVACQP
jgi:hypothetical protein